MHVKALVLAAALFATAFAVLPAASMPASAATTYLSQNLTVSAGPTDAFGGGDYRFIEFGTPATGTDAAFGVVWGNATRANNVYIVAIKARYLGIGQVYWSNGTRIIANKPVKIYTIYAAQLQDILEYKDVTLDGVANYSRTYNQTAGKWSNYAFTTDVGYKLTNLSANWVPGTVTPYNDTANRYRTWDFNLTATNLAYYNITSHAKLTGALPEVRFTFHLNASLVQDTDVSFPQWNITVGQVAGHYVLSSVVAMPDLTLPSVKTVHYDVKFDQLISGWSYANQNNNPATRRLLLEIGSIVANYVPADVLAGWRLLHDLNDEGNATYTTPQGPESADNTTGPYSTPHVFASPNLNFGGARTQIAKFLWVSNSTVDNVTQPVVGQVVGGWAFAILDANGLYYGFVMLLGLNYVGGTTIVHDPSVTSDVVTDLQLPSAPGGGTTGPTGNGLFVAAVLGIVILVILALVALLLIQRRKKEEPPAPPTPPAP